MARVKIADGKSGQIMFRVDPELQMLGDAIIATTGKSQNAIMVDLYRKWVLSNVSAIVGSDVSTSEDAVRALYTHEMNLHREKIDILDSTLGNCIKMWDDVKAEEQIVQQQCEREESIRKARIARADLEARMSEKLLEAIPQQTILSQWDNLDDIISKEPTVESEIAGIIHDYVELGGNVRELYNGVRIWVEESST